MNEQSYKRSREVFDEYATRDNPEGLAAGQAMQWELQAWEKRNFGLQPDHAPVLGVGEEVGELVDAIMGLQGAFGRLAHAQLKTEQAIRGMGDKDASRRAIGDALADIAVFSIQIATRYRLDYWTLVSQVAKEVMQRDWTKK